MGDIKIANWDRLVTSAPSNKAAAIAMGGTDADPTLTAKQLRENLLPTLNRIEEELKTAGPDRRKELGQQKFAIQIRLTKLKPRMKLRPTYTSHFHEAARDLIPRALFRLICDEADRRVKAEEELTATEALSDG